MARSQYVDTRRFSSADPRRTSGSRARCIDTSSPTSTYVSRMSRVAARYGLATGALMGDSKILRPSLEKISSKASTNWAPRSRRSARRVGERSEHAGCKPESTDGLVGSAVGAGWPLGWCVCAGRRVLGRVGLGCGAGAGWWRVGWVCAAPGAVGGSDELGQVADSLQGGGEGVLPGLRCF